MSMGSPWRRPAADTEDYPGLVVSDDRVTGSITTGHSRLPLWCFVTTAICEGWPAVERGWEPSQYDFDAEALALFLYHLLEQRGEFGRLLCVLADEERKEQNRHRTRAWWEQPTSRKRVAKALRRCLDALES